MTRDVTARRTCAAAPQSIVDHAAARRWVLDAFASCKKIPR
jgi:hypothetical protein